MQRWAIIIREDTTDVKNMLEYAPLTDMRTNTISNGPDRKQK